MVSYTTLIKKFGEKGEKTGWTYIDVTSKIAQELNPGNKKGFRVKGFLDQHAIQKTSLLPMGEGDFILPLNQNIRKSIKKKQGETIKVKLYLDESTVQLSEDFITCLLDEPKAYNFFKSLPGSHQRYYSNWIESAKTDVTKTKRITKALKGLSLSLPFNEMMHLDK